MTKHIGEIIIGSILIATVLAIYNILYQPGYVRDGAHERAYDAASAYYVIIIAILITLIVESARR